jgi:hypothetical protein
VPRAATCLAGSREIGLGDYLIAATSDVQGLDLATLHVRHFPMIKDLQARPCLPILQVLAAVAGLDEILDLPAKEPVPRVPMHELTRYWSLPARSASTITSCVRPNSARAVLSLSVAPLRRHSSSRHLVKN